MVEPEVVVVVVKKWLVSVGGRRRRTLGAAECWCELVAVGLDASYSVNPIVCGASKIDK